jgi:hypothetical protein
MDTITEILQDFFVSPRPNPPANVKEQDVSTHLTTTTTSSTTTESIHSTSKTFTNDNTLQDESHYTLKASSFSNKVVFIFNEEPDENISTLSYLLYKLNLVKNIDTMFSNTIQIILSPQHKTLYKKMILENSYMFFTNFDSHNTFSKKLSEYETTKSVIVTDFQSVDVNVFHTVAKRSHVYVLVNNITDDFIKFYQNLNLPKLLIHNKSKLKMTQKQFYKQVIKVLCKNYTYSFEDFFDQINNENMDIRLLIIKNNRLLFN